MGDGSRQERAEDGSALAEEEFDRHPFETKVGAQAVDDKSLVRNVRCVRLISANHKGRWCHTDLCDVVKLDGSTAVDRWWMLLNHFGEEAVQLTCRDTIAVRFVDLIDFFEDFV